MSKNKSSGNKKVIKEGGGYVSYPGSPTKFPTKKQAIKQMVAIKISQGDIPGLSPRKKSGTHKKK
jgi:hypothetical protein